MGYPIFGPQVRWGTPFLVDFWTQFGANLAPSWATLVQELVLDGLVGLREAQRIFLKSPQDAHKTPQDIHKEAQEAHKTPQDDPRGLQDHPKTAQDTSKTAQDAPKTAQEASKTRFLEFF